MMTLLPRTKRYYNSRVYHQLHYNRLQNQWPKNSFLRESKANFHRGFLFGK